MAGNPCTLSEYLGCMSKLYREAIRVSEQSYSSCLVGVLKKCKQSSKEAVDNLESFDSFKKYMHIPRSVETELEQIVIEARDAEQSQLILVCGGVGDGKSHTLAYLKSKYSFLGSEFYLHNDATESFDPQKTSIQTLAECFKDFSDEGLQSGNVKKAVLAINLGALNNFIDSDAGKEFNELRDYVLSKKILESSLTSNDYDPSSYFQFVNFSDYHMFELTESGTKSDYLSGLINKITVPNRNNPFYSSYQDNCINNCTVAKQCPIKQNYELLSNEEIQGKIIDLITKAVISEKLIVSTRAFLNFIYNILVAPRYESLPDDSIKEKNLNIEFNEYIKSLLPYLVFSKPDNSNINSALIKLSPTLTRNEHLDQILINFKTKENITELFLQYLNIEPLEYLLSKLEELQKKQQQKGSLENEIGKLFILLSYFIFKDDLNIYRDDSFDKYIKYLYWSNLGSIGQLENLYDVELIGAIYKWDGQGFGNFISINVGQPQGNYKTLQKLDIEANIIKEPVKNSDKNLTKFLLKIPIGFKKKNAEGFAKVDLDYSLYQLVFKINEGYRPNKNDKLQFINFVDFINKLGELGTRHQEVLIEEVHSVSKMRYSLSYNSTFENYKFTVV